MKAQSESLTCTVLDYAREHGAVRPRDLDALGVPRHYLWRLWKRGQLDRVARSVYVAPDYEWTEHHTLAEVAKRIPEGVVCLLSALQFHDLTTQAAYQVWIAIDPKARKPRINDLPVRIVRFAAKALADGVETHRIENVPVHVTTPARTVADCWKYRNKIGLDVALEALRDYRRDRRGTIEDLRRYLRLNRVENVVRPYLETIA